jgi:pyridoxamine 5'-phosphate oxidase
MAARESAPNGPVTGPEILHRAGRADGRELAGTTPDSPEFGGSGSGSSEAGGSRSGGPLAGGSPSDRSEFEGADVAANLGELRRVYDTGWLDEQDLAPTWLQQFDRWFAEAEGVVREPNAMVFATADAAGRPSARTVLLKGCSAEGFLLFTNYTSRKGQEATANPHGSLVFPWYALERQVIVVGAVERISPARSAEYFRSRPRGSQLGAWASRQSTVVESRSVFERRDAELTARWPEGAEIPVPDFWGGLLVVPETVEFWQGRPNRLHDRLRYRRAAPSSAAAWIVERLSP